MLFLFHCVTPDTATTQIPIFVSKYSIILRQNIIGNPSLPIHTYVDVRQDSRQIILQNEKSNLTA